MYHQPYMTFSRRHLVSYHHANKEDLATFAISSVGRSFETVDDLQHMNTFDIHIFVHQTMPWSEYSSGIRLLRSQLLRISLNQTTHFRQMINRMLVPIP